MRKKLCALTVMGAALAGVVALPGPANAGSAPLKIIQGPMAKSTCMLHAKWEGRCVYIKRSNEVELQSGWYVVQ